MPPGACVTVASTLVLANLLAYLDELLTPDAFSDYGPNGLQVPGRDEVETVVTAVSASTDLFLRAAELGAGLVIVHHGIFWNGAPLALSRPAKRRLAVLLEHDMSLAAYHLPLDGHPEVGNNALIAARLGCSTPEPFAPHKGQTIGIAARFEADGITPLELVARAQELTGREPLAFLAGPERVRTIGIVSGGGSPYLQDAIDAGLDAFLTGEPVERVMHQAQEACIHYVAAGHYATETFGVRRLGELLAERFGIRHVFVDIPNPI